MPRKTAVKVSALERTKYLVAHSKLSQEAFKNDDHRDPSAKELVAKVRAHFGYSKTTYAQDIYRNLRRLWMEHLERKGKTPC